MLDLEVDQILGDERKAAAQNASRQGGYATFLSFSSPPTAAAKAISEPDG